jgi:hypothetical protein
MKPEDVKPSDLGYTEEERDNMSVKGWRKQADEYIEFRKVYDALPEDRKPEVGKKYQDLITANKAVRDAHKKVENAPNAATKLSAMQALDEKMKDIDKMFGDPEHPGEFLPKEFRGQLKTVIEDFYLLRTRKSESELKALDVESRKIGLSEFKAMTGNPGGYADDAYGYGMRKMKGDHNPRHEQ